MKSTVEQEQFSKYCFFCGTPDINGEHHLVYGRGIKDKAEIDGLKVHICNRCHTMGKVIERIHDNVMAEKLSKMFGQAIFERNQLANGDARTVDEAREQFRKRYGQCFY